MEKINSTNDNRFANNNFDSTIQSNGPTLIGEDQSEEVKDQTATAEVAADAASAKEAKRQDKRELRKFERVILSGVEKHRMIGEALKAIATRELYKLKGYRSFKIYCQQEFGITGTHAYRMIQHYDTCLLLGLPVVRVPEKTTRLISTLRASDEEKKQVWADAAGEASDKYPTTEMVKRHALLFKKSRVEPQVPSDTVYVKALRASIKKTDIFAALCEQRHSSLDLLSACAEVGKLLSSEEVQLLTQEVGERSRRENRNKEN